MSTQGKIKTLYSDREQTEAIFPRTTTNAIFDEDGVGLEAILSTTVHAKEEFENNSEVTLNDADTFGGNTPDYFASTEDLQEVNSRIDTLVFPVKSVNLKTGNVTLTAADVGAATEAFVKNEIANAKLDNSGSGVDLSGYATKDDLNNLATKDELESINFPIDSINGKTGAVTLSASDVGALPISGGTLTGNLTLTAGKKIQLSNASGHTSASIGVDSSTGDIYISNINNNWFRIKGDKTMTIGGSKVYTAFDKPTPADIGAAASSHNHIASNITSGTLSADRLPTVPITKGGLGSTNRLDAARNLTNENVTFPNAVVGLTDNHKNFGWTSLKQLRNAAGLGNTTGALPVANGGTGMTGATITSASNSYHTAYFSKFGNLVICSILPKSAEGTQYDVSITIPSGYAPKSSRTFQFYSWTNKNAGGTGIVKITANSGGFLAFQQAHGFSVHDIKYTLSWTV